MILLDVEHIHQWDPRVERPGDTACYRACRAMAKAFVGVEVIPESTLSRIDVSDSDGQSDAIHYIRNQLMMGRPVAVGFDYKPGGPNRDGVTDHFVLVTGAVTDMLHFLDPGTRRPHVHLMHPGRDGRLIAGPNKLSMVVRNLP